MNSELQPEISVVVPVYNVDKFLSRCLDSILAQSLKEIEIICINDGSTDDSYKILKKYARQDKRIIVINQKNQGLSAARNNGIKVAKGDYISFIDSDDYIDADFLKKLYTAATSNNADIAVGEIVWHKPQGDNVLLSFRKQKVARTMENIFNLCDMPKLNYVWNKIYKKELLLDNDLFFPEGYRFEDMLWTPHVLEKCKKAVFVPYVVYHYCFNDNSITNSVYDSKKDEVKYAVKHLFDFIHENFVQYDSITVNLFEKINLFQIKKSDYWKRYYFLNIPIFNINYERMNMKSKTPQKINIKIFSFISLSYINKKDKKIFKIGGISVYKTEQDTKVGITTYYFCGIPFISITNKKLLMSKDK